MTSITLHTKNPVQRPPSPATVSARTINAVATRANADDHFNTKAQSFSRNSPLAQELLPVPDIVIQTENLGKKYTIGHQTERNRYVALRDVLAQNARTFNAMASRANINAKTQRFHHSPSGRDPGALGRELQESGAGIRKKVW